MVSPTPNGPRSVAGQPLYRAALLLLALYPAALYPFLLLHPGLPWPRVAAWSAAYGALLALVAAWVRGRIRAQNATLLASAAAIAAVFVMVGTLGSGLEGAPLALVATELATRLPTRRALLLATAATAVATLLLASRRPLAVALDLGAAWLALVLVASSLAAVAASEERARRALAGALERLAERSRAEERSRIARELHDVLGHRLVGLGLQLEIASYLEPGDDRAAAALGRARDAARELLEDVRQVVHALDVREREPLAAALQALVAGLPSLAVELEVEPGLEAADPLRHDLAVGAARELLTNAARHSGAGAVRLRVESTEGGLEVAAEDPGRGAPEAVATGGLRFLRDRLALVGGRLELRSAPGEGFAARAFIPSRAEPEGPP